MIYGTILPFLHKMLLSDEFLSCFIIYNVYLQQNISAAVYTQTTDVETEVNGLMTYDRAVMKMDEQRIRTINQKMYK